MPNTVYSPLSGTLLSLNQVPDEAFSQGMMGEGCAIMPSEGKVYAPFDGTVEVLPESKHALGLLSNDGIELLIHIGLETVELNGEHFSLHVVEGQSFKKGDVLLEFDIEKIKKAGYNAISPVTITDMENFSSLELCVKTNIEGSEVSAGAELIVLQ